MNRMTKYDKVRQCFKSVEKPDPGRSIIQELGIYEDIHAEEIEKASSITDIRDIYFTKGAKLSPYWENFGKTRPGCADWILCTEGMPKEDMTVLVQFSGKVGNCIFEHAFSTGSWVGDAEGLGWDIDAIDSIAHGEEAEFTVESWMYIPDPRKEVMK